jgi:hypothetical protein
MMDHSKNLNEYVDFVRKKLRMDADNVIIVGGLEGSGKSVFSLLLCNAISHENFDLRKHVAYEPDEFIDAINSAPRYGSVDADEGGETFMSNDAMTIEGRNIKKCLQQCRRKNLNITILSPRHFYLNKASLFRCHTFFYIYTRGQQRGFGIKFDPAVEIWQEGKRPWFEKKFYFNFPDLKDVDRDAYDAYIQMKNERANERLNRYSEEIRGEVKVEKPRLSVDELKERLNAMPPEEMKKLKLIRSKGIDATKVYEYYRGQGATLRVCQIASKGL